MLEKFERYPLTFGSTPIEKLDRLSGHLGNKVNIYAKREDCNSGLAGGGNKFENSNTSFLMRSHREQIHWFQLAAYNQIILGRWQPLPQKLA